MRIRRLAQDIKKRKKVSKKLKIPVLTSKYVRFSIYYIYTKTRSKQNSEFKVQDANYYKVVETVL